MFNNKELLLKTFAIHLVIRIVYVIIVINLFNNDIRSMIIRTKEDISESMDQLMDRDVNILMVKTSYEYRIMTNVIIN